MKRKLPDARFGDVEGGTVDWRSRLGTEPEPDDDELREASPDVIAMLGFDPLAVDEEGNVKSHRKIFESDALNALVDHEALDFQKAVAARKLFGSDGLNDLVDWDELEKGGEGSGNWGHAGRPGEVGGSLPQGETAAPAERSKEDKGGKGDKDEKKDKGDSKGDKTESREDKSESKDREGTKLPERQGRDAKKQIDVKSYPAEAKDISKEQRMAQAKLSDIHATMNKDLDEISAGKAQVREVSGKLDAENVGKIVSNAKAVLGDYTHYLAGDTTSMARDFLDRTETILRDPSLKDLDAKQVDAMMQDSIQKLVYQEVESNRQQFTDHGIRHLVGNMLRADDIMMKMSDGKVSAIDRLAQSFIMVNHDVGYTTPLVREGGLRGIQVSSDHQAFSSAIAEEQKSLWDEGKVFSAEQYERITSIIKTHDAPGIDFEKDLLGSATRISDNLSLFNKEKLPSMFRYVKGGEDYLTRLGEAAAAKDGKAFDSVRKELYSAIDKSNLNAALKRDLKASTKELNLVTPKFTLGVLAGEINSIGRTGNKLDIEIKYDEWDAFLQKHFNMGQQQAEKFLKNYGITSYDKDEYDIGGKIRLRVTGVKKVTKGDLPGHPFRGNQYTDVAGVGVVEVDREGFPITVSPQAKAVKLPADPQDVPRFMEEIRKTPEYQMVHGKLSDLSKEVTGKVHGSKPGDVTFWSLEKHSDENGNLLPERQARHEEIIQKTLNPKAVAPEGERPKMVIIMGPTGGGKSTAGVPEAKKIVENYTYINADDMKEAFKDEYKGWNAAALHEESSRIVEGPLLNRAVGSRHNIVFDLTGKNKDKMVAMVEKLGKLGYDVHVVNIDVPSHVALGRAWERYLKKGRFVDPEFTYNRMDHKPSVTYEHLKKMPQVKSSVSISTVGKSPVVLERHP